MKIKLDRVVIASTNIEAMAGFYNELFDTGLEPFEAYGTTFYRGKLSGLDLVLCPNEIARVSADQNRHQFRFEINDLNGLAEKVMGAGGKFSEAISEDSETKSCAVRDPDGNTIELIERV
jgi:predicted enzyme related to lactoylglutathione lyase